jgi:hypothetical protein
MIQPTVGRVVLYSPEAGEGFYTGPEDQQNFAALVAAVNKDGTINLAVFDASGNSHARQNVPLVQDPYTEPHPGRSFAQWMGYQIGQAAKYEALAATLAEPAQELEPEAKALIALGTDFTANGPDAHKDVTTESAPGTDVNTQAPVDENHEGSTPD